MRSWPRMQMMKIVHLIAYHLLSGPLAPTLQLALAQQQAGDVVWLVSDGLRRFNHDFEEAAWANVQLQQLHPGWRLWLSRRLWPHHYLSDVATLRHWLAYHAVDIVHTHTSHDHSVAALALWGWRYVRRPKLIRTYHNFHGLQRFSTRFWLARSDAAIVRCRYQAKLLQTNLPTPRCTIQIIAGSVPAWVAPYTERGVPSQRWRQEARRRYQLPSTSWVIGHVALLAQRGQEELLLALARLHLHPSHSNVHVLLVGDGEQKKALERMARALHIAPYVHFTGYLSKLALVQAYAAMDVAFLAQPGKDASARAALEAMALGVPLCTVAHPAFADLPHHVQAPSRHPEAIATALGELLIKPLLRYRLQRLAQSYCQRERRQNFELLQTMQLYRL